MLLRALIAAAVGALVGAAAERPGVDRPAGASITAARIHGATLHSPPSAPLAAQPLAASPPRPLATLLVLSDGPRGCGARFSLDDRPLLL